MERTGGSYDRAGNSLTVWSGDPQREHLCEEIGDDVVLMTGRTA